MDTPKPKHDHEPLIFPEGFLWGAATSAHQVEGDNFYNDWWAWEQTQPIRLRSGQAADQYHFYKTDFDLAKSLNHNAHRLSIEWSRIEPEEGKFNQEAIEHYKSVLKDLKNKGFTVMLTLWHFTNPLWFSKKGGWLNNSSSWYFERFVKKIVPELKEDVDLWITLNEPGGYAFDAYGRAKYPPQIRGKFHQLRANWNLGQAHQKAYYAIHQISPSAKVGFSHNLTSYTVTHSHNLKEVLAMWFADKISNHSFYMMTGKTHDFIGISYYYHLRINNSDKSFLPRIIDFDESKRDVSDMGWEIFPEGIYDILMDFSDYHLPIYITENGIASTNDDRRVRFLLSYLKEIYHAIDAGVDVRGYFHWSLIDNYEWIEGLAARFGLIEVDYKTQQRIPRPSSKVYAEVIKNNGIPHKLLKLLGHGLDVEKELQNLKDKDH